MKGLSAASLVSGLAIALALAGACARPSRPPPPTGGPLVLIASAPSVPEPVPAGTFWARVQTVPLGRAGPGATALVENLFCTAQADRVQLTCTDLKTGAVQFTLGDPTQGQRKWQNPKLVSQEHQLWLAYADGGRLLVLEIDPGAGAMLRHWEREVSSEATHRLAAFVPLGSRALVSYHESESRYGDSGYVALLDLEAGRVIRTQRQDGLSALSAYGADLALFRGARYRDLAGTSSVPKPLSKKSHKKKRHSTVRRERSPAVYAFSLSTGEKLWEMVGEPGLFFHDVALTSDGVVFTDDKNRIYRLETKTGRVLQRTEPQGGFASGALAPVHVGQDLFVASERLSRRDAELKVLAQAPKLDWLRGIAVGTDVVAAHSNKALYLLERQSLRLLATFPTYEEWDYRGVYALGTGGFGLRSHFDYNNEGEERLELFRPVASAKLDLSGLPEGVVAYERGHLLGAGILEIAAGGHDIDLLRPGYAPIAIPLTAAAGAVLKPELPAQGWVPVRPLASQEPILPKGMELTTMTPSRTIPRPREFRGTTMFGAGFWLGLEHRTRLWLLDAGTNQLVWSLPYEKVLEAISPTLAERLKTSRFGRLLPAAIAPSGDVAILVTEGLVENHFAAFDLKSGARRWSASVRVKLPHLASQRGGYFTSHFWEALGLFWHRVEDVLFGRDLRTGKLVFEYRSTEPMHGDLVFRGNTLVGLFGEELRALEIPSQKELWSLKVGSAELYPAPEGDHFYVVTDTHIQKINTSGTVVATSQELLGNINDNPTLFTPDGVFACGHFQCLVYGLSEKDLSVRWSYREPSGASPCASLASDTQVLAADGGKHLIFDKRKGKVLSQSGLQHDAKHRWRVGKELCFASYDATTCYQLP